MPDILIGMAHPDSFGAKATLEAGGATHEIFRLDALQQRYDVARLPYSIQVLLANLLRLEAGAKTRCASGTASPSRPTTSRTWRGGSRRTSRRTRSPSRPRAC